MSYSYATGSSEGSATGQADLLNRDKIVLGVGKTETESHIRVGAAEDMRHTQIIAADTDVINRCLGHKAIQVGLGRLRCAVQANDDHQSQNSQQRQSAQNAQNAFQESHLRLSTVHDRQGRALSETPVAPVFFGKCSVPALGRGSRLRVPHVPKRGAAAPLCSFW